MKPVPCAKAPPQRRHAGRQCGDALLEALLCIVLLGIVGLGLTMAAARAMHAQRFASTQGAVLQHMRHAIGKQGVPSLCGSTQTQLTLGYADPNNTTEVPVPVKVVCTPVSLTVGVAGNSQFNQTLTNVTQHLALSTVVTADNGHTALLGTQPLKVEQ